MKNVTFHPGIKQFPALYVLAEKATHRLNEIVGDYGRQTTEAEWDTTEDASKQKRLVTLTLRDLPEEARGSIERESLEKPDLMTLSLTRVWGDLLQARLRRQLRGLMDNDNEESN